MAAFFFITTSGTVLDSFSFKGTDGTNPVNELIQTANGTLFWTATKKGTISGGGAASGVIYTITGLPPKS